MKTFITNLCVIFLLTGCTTAPPARQLVQKRDMGIIAPAADNDIAAKKALEEESWQKMQEASIHDCGVGPLPPDRAQAVQVSNCVTKLINQYVLPHAIVPSLLLSSREEALHIAQDYADGRLSADEYKRESHSRLRRYHDSVIYFMNDQTATNRNADAHHDAKSPA